jgi:hypothetical protein
MLTTPLPKPRAKSVRYEAGLLTLEIEGAGALAGATASVELRAIESLAGATDEQLAAGELLQEGHLLYFRELDREFPVDALVRRIFGFNDTRSAAAILSARGAARGGSVKSEAKAVSSRANGAKGGRPRKNPTA